MSSKFPKSLLETERKQNVSHGLTTISDNTFEFFLNISKVRLKYHNNEAFALYGSSCLTLCEEEIKITPSYENSGTRFLRISN